MGAIIVLYAFFGLWLSLNPAPCGHLLFLLGISARDVGPIFEIED